MYPPPNLPMTSIISWNVRGLNHRNKKAAVRKRVKDYNAGIISLIETRINESKASQVLNAINGSWTCITEEHSFGRIWIICNSQVFKIDKISATDQTIHCEVTRIGYLFSFALTAVYGSNIASDRAILWNSLCTISSSITKPWLVCGDFNCVRHPSEKVGGFLNVFSNHLMPVLIPAFSQTFELQLLSWSKKDSGPRIIMCRLDRNSFWKNLFPQVSYLPLSISDNSPLLIS